MYFIKYLFSDDKEDPTKSESNIVSAINSSPSTVAPTATAEIDEDGYTIRREIQEPEQTIQKEAFYSSSDSDSEDERERKIHVEIKPLNNGTAPISASVDELRATVGNISLSPIGAISVSDYKTLSEKQLTSLSNNFFFHLFFLNSIFYKRSNDKMTMFFFCLFVY